MKDAFFSWEEYEHTPLFSKCYYPWEAFLYLQDYIKSLNLEPIKQHLFPDAYFIHPELIFVGKGTVIEPGSYIQGPCVLGKRCQVRHGAYIRGSLVAGDDCIIGHGTEVKNAIFFNSTVAAHFNYVGNSILGSHVNLGAGVKCANLRLDRQPIWVDWEGKKVDTGLVKLGAIIGDFSQVGCNSVLNPGTLLGKNSICLPCSNVQGSIFQKGLFKPAVKHCME